MSRLVNLSGRLDIVTSQVRNVENNGTNTAVVYDAHESESESDGSSQSEFSEEEEEEEDYDNDDDLMSE